MGKLTNLNPAAPIADGDLPQSIARDTEIADAMAAHLAATDPHLQYSTQAEADARYFRGRSISYTHDPPVITSGENYRFFLPFVGAKFGDPCIVVPVKVNLITSGLWAFTFNGVVVSEDNVGVYMRNLYSSSIDLGSFELRILVTNI